MIACCVAEVFCPGLWHQPGLCSSPALWHKIAGAVSEPDEYLERWPATGLLTYLGDDTLIQQYRKDRTAETRFTSWSMVIDAHHATLPAFVNAAPASRPIRFKLGLTLL